MRVKYDESYMEPKPKKHHGIYCFDCKKLIPTKAMAARQHQGHNVDYLDENGEVQK